ncbi:hypothetical protein B0H14DRAFT_2626762 [Mycena olivaceomarginata]|nr:hypothetical protein B0H14DRAFT_2626762 [Mycena olivaceomarginata]
MSGYNVGFSNSSVKPKVRTSRYQAISILLWNLAPSAQAFWNPTLFPGDIIMHMSSIHLETDQNLVGPAILDAYAHLGHMAWSRIERVTPAGLFSIPAYETQMRASCSQAVSISFCPRLTPVNPRPVAYPLLTSNRAVESLTIEGPISKNNVAPLLWGRPTSVQRQKGWRQEKKVRTSRYQAISILFWNLAPSAQAFWNPTLFPGDIIMHMSSMRLETNQNHVGLGIAIWDACPSAAVSHRAVQLLAAEGSIAAKNLKTATLLLGQTDISATWLGPESNGCLPQDSPAYKHTKRRYAPPAPKPYYFISFCPRLQIYPLLTSNRAVESLTIEGPISKIMSKLPRFFWGRPTSVQRQKGRRQEKKPPTGYVLPISPTCVGINPMSGYNVGFSDSSVKPSYAQPWTYISGGVGSSTEPQEKKQKISSLGDILRPGPESNGSSSY